MTKKRTNLTLDERILIDINLKQRRTMRSIAKIIRRSYPTVLLEVRKRSVNGIYNANVAHDHHLCAMQHRTLHLNKIFSLEDKRYIKEKIESGYPISYLAQEFGTSRATILRHFSQFKPTLTLPADNLNLQEEVEGIKEQIKILFETIKEMKNAKDK